MNDVMKASSQFVDIFVIQFKNLSAIRLTQTLFKKLFGRWGGHHFLDYHVIESCFEDLGARCKFTRLNLLFDEYFVILSKRFHDGLYKLFTVLCQKIYPITPVSGLLAVA